MQPAIPPWHRAYTDFLCGIPLPTSRHVITGWARRPGCLIPERGGSAGGERYRESAGRGSASVRWCPASGRQSALECVEPVGKFSCGGLVGYGAPDVGREAGDLADGDEGVESRPIADVPAVGVGQRVELGGTWMAEAAMGVMRLSEIPLPWPDRHVIPVAEDDLPIGQPHQIVAVRVAMDEPPRVRIGEVCPVLSKLGDPAGKPPQVGVEDGVRGAVNSSGHAPERVGERVRWMWGQRLVMQLAKQVAQVCGRRSRFGHSGQVAPEGDDTSLLHDWLVVDVGGDGARESARGQPPGGVNGGGDALQGVGVGGDPDEDVAVRDHEQRVAVQSDELGVGYRKVATGSGRGQYAAHLAFQVVCHQVRRSTVLDAARIGRAASRNSRTAGSRAWSPSACRSSEMRSRTRCESSPAARSEEHTSELQSPVHLVCRLLLEKKKKKTKQLYVHKKQTQKT